MLKVLVLVAFIAVANSQTTGPGVVDSRCPPNATPNPPLHLNDPSDCQNFFTCVGGLAMPQRCPDGQHWSTSTNICDWPDRAGCALGGSCPPGNPTPPHFLPDTQNCERFYKCSWGSPIRINCPAGQHWDVRNNVCDWPDRANCNLGSTTSAPNTSTSTRSTSTRSTSTARTTTRRR